MLFIVVVTAVNYISLFSIVCFVFVWVLRWLLPRVGLRGCVRRMAGAAEEIALDDSQHEARGACQCEGVGFIPELSLKSKPLQPLNHKP